MHFNKCRYTLLTIVFFCAIILSLTPSFLSTSASETESPQEIIQKYREFLKTASHPAAIAEAHYEMGYALEELGRDTEATAEYLKIIINYPEFTEISKKAEERLSLLYSAFEERTKEMAKGYTPDKQEKDPAIFFAYIKSLYENQRNMGRYDKAISVLEELYNLDSANPEYLIEMGDIYLHGYNDADKAIAHFKNAIKGNPKSELAYVSLGIAYEKKGDYEKALEAYKKVREISPASQWAMYCLRRLEGIRLARDKKLIKDWYIIGPFDNSDKEGLRKEFPPEKEINLNLTYPGKENSSVVWFRPFGYEDSGYVDLNELISPNDYTIAYALTYVFCDKKRELELRCGSQDGVRIWINGEEAFYSESSGSAEVDDHFVVVKLKKGWNEILLKVSSTWGGWGFYFRITDLQGNPLEALVFDPVRDEARLEKIYRKIKKEKRLKITSILLVYVGGAALFLLGLYLAVSNIYHRIKINRMKEDFVSSVSHELKTPIAAVKMFAETLKEGRVKRDEMKAQYYDMMIRESDRLTRFIDKILDFSKIEKGKKIYTFEKEDVSLLARQAVEIFRNEIRDEYTKLEANTGRDPVYAEVDRDAVLQVILNLLENAYKYSGEEKKIDVTVSKDKLNVRIEITDNGFGMPKDGIEKIFDKFYRADREIVGNVKGSGLGLSFVKSVISAHSGKIAVESELGKGSTFIILLPAEKV